MRDAPNLANQKLYNQIKYDDRFFIEMPIDHSIAETDFNYLLFVPDRGQSDNRLKQIFR